MVKEDLCVYQVEEKKKIRYNNDDINRKIKEQDMKIGLDIDNVITAFDERIYEEMLQEDKKKRNAGIVNPTGDWIKYLLDWSQDEIDDFFNQNMERIAKDLKPKKDAKYYIDKLLKQGHEIYLISHRAYPHYQRPYETTVNWLKENRIEYTELVLTESTNKTKECKQCQVDIMFDDVQSNCHKLIEGGVNCYLVETKYNKKNREGLKVVGSWKDIYQTINQLAVTKLEKVHVILDTDTNNEADDQFALAYLLKSKDRIILDAVTIAPYMHEKESSIEEGIEKSYKVASQVFDLLGEDKTNLIYKGSTDYRTNGYQEENEAVRKIVEVVMKNEVTYLLAIGAITNVAIAIEKHPEIINKIKVIWLGGHSFLSQSNREFNFKQDLMADRIVFQSKVDLTVIPCENVSSNLVTTIYELQEHFNIQEGLGKFLYDRFYCDGLHGFTPRRTIWDIAVIGYMINPYWFEVSKISCPEINDDLEYVLTEGLHQVTFVHQIEVNNIFKDMFRKIGDKNEIR